MMDDLIKRVSRKTNLQVRLAFNPCHISSEPKKKRFERGDKKKKVRMNLTNNDDKKANNDDKRLMIDNKRKKK